MNDASILLDRIAILQRDIEAIEEERDEKIAEILPQDVRAMLNHLENEANERITVLLKQIEKVTDQVREVVLRSGESMKGQSGYQAVYQPGRTSWDTKALDAYAATRPEVAAYKKQGEPFVTIRKA